MSTSLWDTIKETVASVAPAVAAAIGGPAAGFAVNGLCSILGLKPNSGEEEIEKALQKATTKQWIKIKEFELEYRKLEIREIEIANEDRESARSRETKMAESGNRDFTPPVLALSILVGFFGLILTIIWVPIPHEVKDLVEVMFGMLGTSFIQMVSHYFGSPMWGGRKNKTTAKT